jgi:integrase
LPISEPSAGSVIAGVAEYSMNSARTLTTSGAAKASSNSTTTRSAQPPSSRGTRLNEALPEHLSPVVRFALASGCRMSEILRLEWNRVDFGRRVAWLDPGTTKNGEGRGIPLNNDAVLALRAVHGDQPRRCFTYQGEPMRAVGSAWERSLRRSGIEEFRFHDLRHTWASWHVMSGTSLQELMELGGWKSYEMVLRYAHLAPEHLSAAVQRIERVWGVVGSGSTISLRQKEQRPTG